MSAVTDLQLQITILPCARLLDPPDPVTEYVCPDGTTAASAAACPAVYDEIAMGAGDCDEGGYMDGDRDGMCRVPMRTSVFMVRAATIPSKVWVVLTILPAVPETTSFTVVKVTTNLTVEPATTR